MNRTGARLKCGLARPGHVHVWTIRLLRGYLPAAVLSRHLNYREQALARTYRDASTKRQYQASRYAVRKLASCYAAVAAGTLVLSRGGLGQPLLKRPRGRNGTLLHLSISHSERAFALAFSRHARVGVDIDTTDHPPAVWRNLSRHFRSSEHRFTQPLQMIECWTRKEALLKALGSGLGGLPLLPPLPERASTVRLAQSRWHVTSLPTFNGCAVACATDGPYGRLSHFTLGSLNALKRIR